MSTVEVPTRLDMPLQVQDRKNNGALDVLIEDPL